MDIPAFLDRTIAAPVWQHFQNIAKIPHPSGHEEGLCQHIIALAERNQLVWKRDSVGNLVVCKPATPGREHEPAVILQSHLDMVPEKTDDSQHDFQQDAIRLQKEGEWLTATDTTLGADNGIGIAAMLAVLEDYPGEHGPLEALFTVTEETTMAGAQGLDPTLLHGNILLNLDTEEDHTLVVGCAGGINIEARHECSMEPVPVDYCWFHITLSGLNGGHSGCDIHLQRGNAIQLMARVLKHLESLGGRLSQFHGGTLDNAIPRQADAVIGFPAGRVEAVYGKIDSLFQILKQEFSSVDAALSLAVATAEPPTQVFPVAIQQAWLNALHSCHHGVKRYSDDFPGVVETSNNLGVLAMTDGSISADCFVRSLVDSATLELAGNIGGLFSLTGARVQQVGFFPGWKPSTQSPVQVHMAERYLRLHGEPAEIRVLHAALECGIIGDVRPGMDMISFGPTIENAHTPRERVRIASVDKFWALLQATLTRLALQAE